MKTELLAQLALLDLSGQPQPLLDPETPYTLAIFLRHLACLLCQEHLREVKTMQAELTTHGVGVTVISFAQPTALVHYQQAQQWPFRLLADPERSAYRAVALERLPLRQLLRPRVLARYARLLWHGRQAQRPARGEDVFQAGGDFLLAASGQVLYAHRSYDPADRPTLECLRDLLANTMRTRETS